MEGILRTNESCHGEDWTSLVGDDGKRLFKDFSKRVPLKGYSEEGKNSIEYEGCRRLFCLYLLVIHIAILRLLKK